MIAPDLVVPLAAMLERAVAEYGREDWGDWTLGGIALFGTDPSVRRMASAKRSSLFYPNRPATMTTLPCSVSRTRWCTAWISAARPGRR